MCVAGGLLDERFPVPKDIQATVAELVRDIVAAQRVIEGAPFGEDFTQYRPRGHYIAGEVLQRYFRAYKWLARRVLDAQKAEDLRKAVFWAWLLQETPNGLERYRKLVNAVSALAGEPVGMSIVDVLTALSVIRASPKQALQDFSVLQKLRDELMKPEYRVARIVTHPVPPQLLPPPATMPQKQIRFLPEAQLPDAELLQWTGDPQVPQRMPSGLDVAAALGSQRAVELLQQSAHGSLVLERIKPFQQTWGKWQPEDWQRSIYLTWLWAIKALLETDEHYPSFMRTVAWQDWKLNSALASWAHLRHAYGLYAAPVYTVMGLREDIPKAYLEPNPRCYERLAIATEQVKKVTGEIGGLSPNLQTSLQIFAQLMRRYAAMAEKELRGEALSEEEVESICGFSDFIFSLPRETPVTVMDIVTHAQTGHVLHVASGKLHPVLIVVKAKPYPPFVAVGWSLSYYEFTRPNFQRLTDGEWEAWLNRDVDSPDPPFWALSFRFSAREGMEGFAELRQGEALLAQQPQEGIAVLQQVAQRYSGTWVSSKARLLMARHFHRNGQFQEAWVELERFYHAPNLQLLEEAKEVCGNILWE